MKSFHWSRLFPFLQWPRLTAALLSSEASAGITVAMVMLPQVVAYAALAGMPLVTGLYAAFFPALVALLWGGTTRVSVGPTALTCLLIGASLAGMAEPASPQWIALAVWLALLSGALQLVLGFGRFGWLLNLVSAPVMAGFTQAAGILIIASQLPALLGLKGALSSLWASPTLDATALVYGMASVALLWLGKTYVPKVPMVMLVVVGGAIVSQQTGFEAGGGAVVGALPIGLPSFYVPTLLNWSQLGELVMPAIVIALISFLETASSAKMQCKIEGTRWNDNQDLIGQGLAKIASAFSGSFATSGSFSRSALNIYAGARTGWAGIVATTTVLLALLLLMPALHHVPRAVLSAVVIMAVIGMIKPRQFVALWRIAPVECLTSLATFGITLLTAPRIYWGVMAGVMLGMTHFLVERLHPRIIEVGLHPDGSLRDRHLWKLPPLAARMYALRMDAAIDFATASSFEGAISEYLAAHPDTQHVCLFTHPINRMDATGAEVFGDILRTLKSRGITLHISGIKLPVETVLRRAHLLEEGPLLHMYRTDNDALDAIATLEGSGISAQRRLSAGPAPEYAI